MAFDKYDQRPSKTQRINSLAYCSQAVLSAAEDMKEAAIGTAASAERARTDQGLEPGAIAAFLQRNAEALEGARFSERTEIARPVAAEAAKALRDVATQILGQHPARLEELERRLTVLEEKLLASLLTSTPDEEMVTIRAEADRDMAPYRRKMSAPQIDQLQKQYIQKKLLERYRLPRLSLFYM